MSLPEPRAGCGWIASWGVGWAGRVSSDWDGAWWFAVVSGVKSPGSSAGSSTAIGFDGGGTA